MERTKVYKPEFEYCPLCGAKLKYRHTISNKQVHFYSGTEIRIKNLGYSCTNEACTDNKIIYSSQTAAKFCPKGYTYSAKVLSYIVVLKDKKISREEICNRLALKGIEISDRNVDMIYDHFKELSNKDYRRNIEICYNEMINRYNKILLSIDSLIVDDYRTMTVRSAFNNEIIGFHIIPKNDTELVLKLLNEYVSNDKIDSITTTRRQTSFFSLVEKAVARPMKYYYFLKM